MSTLRRQVGALIRHHRERAGLSQAELGDKIGKALETIGRIERGKASPSLETLEAIAIALKVEARDLFGAGEFAAKSRQDDPLSKLLDRVSSLSDSDIEWADKLLALALTRRSKG
jgi:transcriptional regulator with XRE-family HTH domain